MYVGKTFLSFFFLSFHIFIFQIIDESVLCVHGGLSPDIKTIDQIRTIERNQEIPHKGAFCDILLYIREKFHNPNLFMSCLLSVNIFQSNLTPLYWKKMSRFSTN